MTKRKEFGIAAVGVQTDIEAASRLGFVAGRSTDQLGLEGASVLVVGFVAVWIHAMEEE